MLANASPLIVYAITLFASALLLFLVQPMIGKQILPKFGGAPAVWSTCMVFYQGVLLAGYSYAHFITKKFPPRKQIMIHMGVLLLPLLAFLAFPVGYAYKGLNPPGDQNAALWVLIILTLLIGLPFFVVSTSAPLFQRWFAHTGHEAAQDPYFLYAASNLGSMISLILYPFVIELTMGLPSQGLIFMIGYGVLVALAGWAGFLVLKQLPADPEVMREASTEKALVQESAEAKALADVPEPDTETEEEAITDKPAQVVVKSKKMRAKDRAKAATLEAISKEPTAPRGKEPTNGQDSSHVQPEIQVPADTGPGPLQYLRWILLGFVPSSLMLGVTMYMSTDVAAVPLLWLIPLTLYLLSFIIVFSPTMDRLYKGALAAPVRLILRERGRALTEGTSIHSTMVLLMPVVVLLMIFQMISGQELPSLIWRFVVHLSAMFIVAMVCHGELARTRPAPEYLTGFYLAMSFGGVLGGIFNALIAPVIFNTVAEYSLVLVVACMLLPPLWEETRSQFNRYVDIFLAVALGGAGAYVLILYFARYMGMSWGEGAYQHLPTFSALPGLQVQVVGYLMILAGAAALFAYIARAPLDQKLERVLDMALPIALCLLTMLIIGMGPFDSWTTVNSKLFAAIAGVIGVFQLNIGDGMLRSIFTYGIPVALCYGFAERPIRLGLGVGAILLASALQPPIEDYGRYVDVTVYRERSFFGVLKVEHQNFKYLDGDQIGLKTVYHKLLHGTTLHGMQRMLWEPEGDTFATVLAPLAFNSPLQVTAGWGHVGELVTDPRQEALTYYHRTGPVGQVYKALVSGANATRPVAFIGLGTGTMASYANPGQKVTFYEIDHAVVRIAEDPKHFTYLQACKERGGDYEFVMGDARLMMEKAPDNHYKLIVVDAFSSDAIPIHLTTKEAIELYLRKAADDGVIAMHISNRHLELEPVLANIAHDLGVFAIEQYDNTTQGMPGKNASDWIMIAKKPENYGPLWKDVWRWPADDDRRWKDLVHKVDAQQLSVKDVEDWKKQHMVARENAELRKGREDFEVTEEFEKLVWQRVQKMESPPSPDERSTIRNEEANKLIKQRVQAALDKEKKDLDAKPDPEIRKMIQREIDRQWEKDMKWRNRVGVWTDDFSNILSIWRDFNRN